jgi:hypothetical protein
MTTTTMLMMLMMLMSTTLVVAVLEGLLSCPLQKNNEMLIKDGL